MSLYVMVGALIVVGVLLYFLNTYVTVIDPKIKQLINAVVIIAVVIWILIAFIGPLPDIRIGR